MNPSFKNPIIIMGMHRSGTSLVTQILESAGLFVGDKKDSNYESMLFKFLNQWILTNSSGSWDSPESIEYILANKEMRNLTEDYLESILVSRHLINYLGLKNFLKYRKLDNLTFKWGWKDPRNTFTFPIWSTLFPKSNVIHVYRHGVDVAQSLKVRYEKAKSREIQVHKLRKQNGHYYLFSKKRRGFVNSVHFHNLDNGLDLWNRYMTQANFIVTSLNSRALLVKYEDLLHTPQQTIQKLLQFCGLPSDQGDFLASNLKIKPSRAYAFKQDSKLEKYAIKHQDCLAKWGYGNLDKINELSGQ